MKKPFHSILSLAVAAASLAIAGLSARADTVYMTTYGSGGAASSTLTPCPPYCNNPLALSGVTISTFGSTATVNPSGCPAHSKCTYGLAGTVNWSIQTPTLAVPGGVYSIEVAHSNPSSCTSNALVTIFSADGIVTASCTNTPVFQRPYGSNAWTFVGYITNSPGMSQPTITFYLASGQVDNGSPGNRLYIEAFKFTLADPCYGVAPTPSIPGPLVAGQTSVKVAGIVAGATNVTVFGPSGQIGQATSASFPAGTVTVTTTALSDGDAITAQQFKNGCMGDLSNPTIAGSGPNPPLQVALQVGKNASLTGPIGAASGGSGAPQYWIHADGRRSQGFGVGPTGGIKITPSTNWVTLTFNSDTDPVYDWSDNVFPYVNTNNYAALQGLALAIDDTTPDIGPYQIYIDSIYNGTNLIQGFEGFNNYTYGVTFLRPSASTTTGKYLAAAPDTNYVYNVGATNSDTGTNSLFVTWAFAGASPDSWLNLYCGGTGTQYPQIDLHQPVTIRMLVLPVGETVGRRFDGNVSFITNSSSQFWSGGSNTLGVTVTGGGTYTYQWALNGGDISGATDVATTLQPATGLTTADSGLYTVTVTDEGAGAIVRSLNVQVFDPIPSITNPPVHTVVTPGSTANLSVGADGHVASGYPLGYQWEFFGTNLDGATSSALSIPDAQAANSGFYDVIVSNSYGMVTSAPVALDVVAVLPANGTGVRGTYFTNLNYGSSATPANLFTNAPVLTRLDPTINFEWGTGAPAAGVSVDYFSVLWTGQLLPLGEGDYSLYTTTDDGVRLWVDGALLIDKWVAQAPTSWTNTLHLTQTKHDLVMEYFERGSGAVAHLNWFGPGITPQTIPMTQLFPTISSPTLGSGVSGSGVVLSWSGPFFLQSATNILGPWTPLYTATSPFTNNLGSEPERYFRLSVP